MPKRSSSYQHNNSKFQHSTQPLQRRPIHEKGQKDEDEDEICDEEEEEIDLHQNNKKIYPDLTEFMRQQLQDKSPNTGKKNKVNELKQSQKSEKVAYETSSFSVCKKYVIYVLLFLPFLLGLGYKFDLFHHGDRRKSTVRDVTELINDMQNHFKEQQSQTFLLLKLALRKVVDEKSKPSAPAIITVVANRGAEHTASDFSIYLAKALVSEEYVSINESAHWHANPDGLKFKIHDVINSKLENGNLNVVIVDRLHNIPIDAAMIFHGYCDHEFALYKRAVFLFIVHLKENVPENANSKHIDSVAINSLRNIWLSATDDKVDSLITRITGSVINIR